MSRKANLVKRQQELVALKKSKGAGKKHAAASFYEEFKAKRPALLKALARR